MTAGLELTPAQRQVQKMSLTLQQRQALHMLQLCLPDLRADLFRAMNENPVIEDIEASLEKETTSQKEREAEERAVESDDPYRTDDIDDHAEVDYTADADALERRQRFFDNQTREETLEEHLSNQLESSDIDPEDKKLAEILIGELNADGRFDGSFPDVMMVTGESEEKIRKVLAQIMELDPPGCGATSIEECLLAQMDKLDGSPYQQEVRELLERHHLTDIAEGRIVAIEQDLHMSRERYVDVLTALRTLEPRPGRAYLRAGKSIAYVNPEVHAVNVDGRWVARVDDRSLPDIRISKQYIRMLEDPKTTKETKDYIRERIAAAQSIIEAIERREETITSISQAILDAQPDFFVKGLKGLRPLTMQEVADKVGVHHATVSRTVNNKYISTPKGTVELRKFFVQGVSTEDGELVARTEVLDALQEIIDAEDKRHPLSDEKIADALKAKGYTVARRTVAKYRTSLDIPGTSDRRQA